MMTSRRGNTPNPPFKALRPTASPDRIHALRRRRTRTPWRLQVRPRIETPCPQSVCKLPHSQPHSPKPHALRLRFL
eukprot:16420563-Heterocapsa_arctica.AAC.1